MPVPQSNPRRLNSVGTPYRPQPRVPIAGVPRNFATGHMLAMVTLFALVCSLLAYEEAGREWYVVFSLFIPSVVLGQMFLFRGREPRFASCLIGACVMPFLWTGLLMVSERSALNSSWFELTGFVIVGMGSGAVLGVISGYLVGTVCAGIFLVTERQWDAGKIIEVEPILAEVVPEEERTEPGLAEVVPKENKTEPDLVKVVPEEDRTEPSLAEVVPEDMAGQRYPEPVDSGERRSLEQEIELLGLGDREAESLRKMAREAEGRMGLSRPSPTHGTVRRYRPPARIPIAGIPRSFNAGRMLVIVTMFALLFSLLQVLGAPTPVYPLVGIFCGALVLGQMILFRGRQPRIASCIVGACMMPLLVIITIAVAEGSSLLNVFRVDPVRMLGSLLCIVVSCAVLGVVVGYIIGTLCAGVFLIVDRQWNAGQIIPVTAIETESASENEVDDRPSTPEASDEKDPWSEST